MRRLLFSGALAAAASFFFDPQNGRRRRALMRDRLAGFFRRTARRAERSGRGVAADAYGVAKGLQHRQEEPKEQPNDATLARKVESEIFRDPDVPKGQISVNAENGVVFLRGEVERPELIETLVEETRKVQGVQGVENLLHLPGTQAPHSPGS
jgi:osmotically-inducible protein OsmY